MRTLEQIDQIIGERSAKGARPCDIASYVHKPADWVRARMDVLGIHRDEGSRENKFHVHPMWDAKPDDLRLAIWKRQRDGASKALRAR